MVQSQGMSNAAVWEKIQTREENTEILNDPAALSEIPPEAAASSCIACQKNGTSLLLAQWGDMMVWLYLILAAVLDHPIQKQQFPLQK